MVISVAGAWSVATEVRESDPLDRRSVDGSAVDGAAWPRFDETLVEPASYRATFRGPSHLSPSPWFEAVRGAGDDTIVVEIDRDGPGPMRSTGMVVRREGAWYLDLVSGTVGRAAPSDATTWIGFDDATRLRTFSQVTGGAVRPHLTLVDDHDDGGPGRRGAHGLHVYVFELDQRTFCAVDRFSCDAWFRSFGLNVDDRDDTPLASSAGVTAGLRRDRAEASDVATISSGARPAIDTDDTTPDGEVADGRVLVRLTVDRDGLLWDVELRRGDGRVMWISLDELSPEPFDPPPIAG